MKATVAAGRRVCEPGFPALNPQVDPLAREYEPTAVAVGGFRAS